MAGKKDKGHASLQLYAKIIITLALITVAEIVVPYVIAHDTNNAFGIAALIVLGVAKYVLVVAFFMHLYYDQPLCTFLFVAGMLLGGGTMAGLLSAIPKDAYTRDQYGSGGVTTSGSNDPYHGPPLDEKGKEGLKLFAANCVTCHTLSNLDTAKGVIGPNLDGIWERAGKRIPGKTAEQYIDQSIKDPGAYVVEGYQNAMTNFGFDDAKRAALVDFLMTQGKPVPKQAGASPSPSGSGLPATPAPGSGVSPSLDAVQESQASPNAGGSPGGYLSPAPNADTSPDVPANP